MVFFLVFWGFFLSGSLNSLQEIQSGYPKLCRQCVNGCVCARVMEGVCVYVVEGIYIYICLCMWWNVYMYECVCDGGYMCVCVCACVCVVKGVCVCVCSGGSMCMRDTDKVFFSQNGFTLFYFIFFFFCFIFQFPNARNSVHFILTLCQGVGHVFCGCRGYSQIIARLADKASVCVCQRVGHVFCG